MQDIRTSLLPHIQFSKAQQPAIQVIVKFLGQTYRHILHTDAEP